MTHYKLVRDKIPAEIVSRGASCECRRLTGLDFYDALRNKLIEESQEVRRSQTRANLVEELADVQAVLDHICAFMRIGSRELNSAVCEKQRRKGRFSDGIFLLTSQEP